MTFFTFDDLAVQAYASGSVDAWMRLIDEAIDLGRVKDVLRLWIRETSLEADDAEAVREMIPDNLPRRSPSRKDTDWVGRIPDRAEGKVPA